MKEMRGLERSTDQQVDLHNEHLALEKSQRSQVQGSQTQVRPSHAGSYAALP